MVGLVVAGLCAIAGLASAVGSLQAPPETNPGRDRFLVAVHGAARSGFWFALAAAFALFSLVEDPFPFRWFGLLPIAMAGLRLATAFLLSRG